jgi:hypothetical protein
MRRTNTALRLVFPDRKDSYAINAPERFLTDSRNRLFKDHVRFREEALL